MKRIFIILAAVLITASVFAQTPEKMSYQAIIRDASNQLVQSQDVGMQISVLQGSADGTVVYVETHTPTTNANGLVTLEIGTGTTSDNFSTIDWSNDTYFIKTETDPVGGTNYTITSTSQLLSVPYALHAKSADNFTGEITETDPIYTGSKAANITSTDITNLNNLSGTNTGDQDISGILTNTQIIQDTASAIRTDIPTITTYSVGDFAQGGIVFWVDETGQHGLVCSKADQNAGRDIKWYNGSYTDTEAHGDGVYAGEMNTMLIIANQGNNSNGYAAGACANLILTENDVTYGNWYLPSKKELDLMYQNKATINYTAEANGGGPFGSTYYWSSTERTIKYAWVQYFTNGNQSYSDKDYANSIRPVRAF